ncbi:hypothetical protein GPECTOR_32g449 [Gonium pectorale]|uniref:Carboxypeptidase n=1 Tax=Gonium pectorale TaxID=33097 RepID=A0A150GDB1_GONPE|nr:hypothetical protein GPECTOR_32g449 [Gonium pectorale]|eukprot:KXZ47837.1 hypothetical protein GPECTOR_32g449 [Gonium pectorale]
MRGLATVALVTLAICSTSGASRSFGTLRVASDQQAAQQQELRPASAGGGIADGCGSGPDEICSLPGLAGNLHLRMRSGYITVSEVSDRRLWYLVADREAGAAAKPEEAEEEEGEEGEGVSRKHHDGDGPSPVILYADVERDGDGGAAAAGSRPRDVVLKPNPFSWTKLATVIYVDSPAGAGMSYSGRPDVDYHTNDEYTIADLVTFLGGLTDRYPELATAPFYIAGESYGGVFVPLLAAELLRVNEQRGKDGKQPLVNITGYSVGNPVTDDTVDGNAQMQFAADMGYVDPPTWRHIRKACDDMFWNATPGTECYDSQGVVKDELWDLNWYDVLDTCVRVDYRSPASTANGVNDQPTTAKPSLASRFFWPFTARRGSPADAPGGAGPEAEAGLEAGRRGGRRLWGPWLRHVAPCLDRRVALDWLNREEVRSALHAAPVSQLGWQPCSDVLYYRLDTAELVPLHEGLVRDGLRALVYSGDHDMVVPHTGTRAWLYDKARLGRADGPLRPWNYKGQVAGWTARFSAGTGLRYATIKGAGHMVPQSKPREMLHLLRAFLNDEEL